MTIDPPSHPPTIPLSATAPVEWDADEDGFAHRDETDPAALTPERRLLCMIVRQLTEELLRATGLEHDQDPGRRATSHVRQVAMYVCHVALRLTMTDVA
eukprot:gene6735-8080_t